MTTCFPKTVRLLVSALLLLAGASAAGCQGPSFIDKECIKGRISSEQANKINKGPWEHLPTYNRNAEGKCKDCAEEKDRIFAAKCSHLIKEVTLQDL
jgi:hypothetical protein